jgi:hypothetical protein
MKAIAGLILTFLLGAMFIGLFHLSSGMNMTGGVSDCLFMSHEEVLCPMNVVDLIGTWQSTFLATATTILLLLAAAGTVALVASIAPHLLTSRFSPIPILSQHIRERTYTFTYRPLQELFSNGILHPKLF